jgi:hypothetical protein
MVPIGHIEQFLNTVDDTPLNAAGYAIAGQNVVEQAKHRGGL